MCCLQNKLTVEAKNNNQVTAQLICASVYALFIRISHDAAQMSIVIRKSALCVYRQLSIGVSSSLKFKLCF